MEKREKRRGSRVNESSQRLGYDLTRLDRLHKLCYMLHVVLHFL